MSGLNLTPEKRAKAAAYKGSINHGPLDPSILAAVRAANLPKLLAIAEAVKKAMNK